MTAAAMPRGVAPLRRSLMPFITANQRYCNNPEHLPDPQPLLRAEQRQPRACTDKAETGTMLLMQYWAHVLHHGGEAGQAQTSINDSLSA